MDRRNFIEAASITALGALVLDPMTTYAGPAQKKKLAMVGTGIRGTRFWGESVLSNYGDLIEFVGLCDINPGRVQYARERMKLNCPTFTDLEEMLRVVKPDIVIVTTMDSEHNKQIVKALEMGVDVITEKPMTTDEVKCKEILDAEKRTGRKVIVAFNYRHGPHPTKIKELLMNERIGKITSVDFNWYLNVYHGADYFRRWHGIKKCSGSLWVHKATHHFDLLNWWLDSDPVEVSAYGKLEHYGKSNPFRGPRCMKCDHKDKCKFYWDITKDETMMKLYVANEKYDGYIRDNCVFRDDIDIYDKMSAQVIYANGVTVNYSLTTYSPYEGWRISFNGMNGKMDSWLDIPYQPTGFENISQQERHEIEMKSEKEEKPVGYGEIIVGDNFKKDVESIKVPKYAGGHGGGDIRMHDRIFRHPGFMDTFHHMAGTRDGAMSLLIGVAARKSIAEKRPVRISELTDIGLMGTRPASR
jgi:predicted dehydrogenase